MRDEGGGEAGAGVAGVEGAVQLLLHRDVGVPQPRPERLPGTLMVRCRRWPFHSSHDATAFFYVTR